MPNHKVYLGKIKDPLPLKDMEAKMLRNEPAKPLRINFDQHTALLDINQPRHAVWAKMLALLQKDDRPAYVEVDADTDIITRLYVPIAAKVLEIYFTDEAIVYVTFNSSQARHSLRRDLPEFELFYGLLQAAKESGATLMVTATMHKYEIVDVRPLLSSSGNECDDDDPTPEPPIVPVSEERCVELFNLVSGKTCMPDAVTPGCIPFKYPSAGFQIRAHLMCYIMIAAGATPEKMWISPRLTAYSSNDPQCEVHWGYHVAPTLMVTQDSGPDVKMVIDPSLCTGPVTVDYWKSLQGNPNAKLTPACWKGYGFLAAGRASQQEANDAMQDFRLFLEDMWEKDGKPPYKCPPEK